MPYRLQQRSYSPLSSSDSGEDTAKQVDLSPNRIPNSPYTIVKDEINTPELTPVLQNKDLLVYQPASLDSLTNTYGRSEQTEYNQPNLTRNTLHPVQNTSTVINSTFATSTPVSTTYRPSYGTSNIPTQSTVNEVTKVTNVGGPSVNTNTKGTSNISTDDNIPFKETTMVTNVGGPSVNTNTKGTSNISTDDNIPFKETTMVTNVGGPSVNTNTKGTSNISTDDNIPFKETTMVINVGRPSLNTNTNETDNIDGNLPTKVTPLTIPVNQKPNQQENIQTETQILVDFNNVEGYLKSCHIDITPETKQAIEEAFKGDDNQQKPKGIYTILLVDTSKSMDGEPGQQMKNYLVNFIDEVENSAANNNLEENVAVVTFGAKTSINHRFTNDFGAIRESFENLHFEGRSPLLTGLALCVKYLKETGEVLDITSVVRVKPRIILVTDGLVTNDSHFTGQDHEQNSIQCQTKVLNFLSSTKHLGYQIICVGMGEYNKL
ncbi:hypothetical protein KUTeg_018383 [Tegillarca granosa]|uniref:VWFA domain-containing protein n=1 Tax=Tegillarca granosa TaxID=220873 RepID=A0ABQ9EN24_TEGGR|nr:hypothetical protein KUTeg_018383 [Tegillarca granosa]